MGAGRRISTLAATVAVSIAGATTFAANAQAAESWSIDQEELTTNGSSWTFTEATADGSAVWAAGIQDEHIDQSRLAVARWNGSGWSEITAPPSVDPSLVTGFSAPSSDNLWLTVEHSYDGLKRIYHYDGSSWTKITTTNSGGKIDQISASASRAWTIASDHYVARYLDGSWTRMLLTSTGEIEAIDARSRSDVWAVGNAVEGEGDDDEPPTSKPFASHWNGTKWTKTSVPVTNCELVDVTAVASNDAWANCLSHDRKTTTVVRWNGTSWSKVGSTLPFTAKITATADGHAWVTGGTSVRHYDGTAWTSAQVPAPTGDNAHYDEPRINDVTVVPGTHSVFAAGESVHIPEDPMGNPLPRIDLVWRNG